MPATEYLLWTTLLHPGIAIIPNKPRHHRVKCCSKEKLEAGMKEKVFIRADIIPDMLPRETIPKEKELHKDKNNIKFGGV